MNRLSVIILLLGAFASLAVAASAPTFCKCTCFTNSTIIEIKPKSSTGGSSSSSPPSQHQPPASEGSSTPGPPSDADDENAGLSQRAQGSASSPSCSQCNRSFCLSQSLPICKGAADKDVVTMCFQRDSRKDQVIVWGFILGTAGLLGWAGVQKVADLHQQQGGGGGGVFGGGGTPGIGGGAGGGGGGAGAGGRPPRGRREGVLPLARGALGSTGRDGGRGAYAAVAGHSRESSVQTS